MKKMKCLHAEKESTCSQVQTEEEWTNGWPQTEEECLWTDGQPRTEEDEQRQTEEEWTDAQPYRGG